MPLFDTVLEQVELGPASVIDTGTTANSGNSGYTVKGETTESWHLYVRPGDYIYFLGNVKDGAMITKVVDNRTLEIAKPIAANSTPFLITRPTEIQIRPPTGVEWEIHNIVVTPRIDGGTSYDLQKFPVEVWSTDDNKPKTLLFTSQNYPLLAELDSKPYLRYTLRISQTWITIKPTYFGWLLIRNTCPLRMDVFVNGIEKTIARE